VKGHHTDWDLGVTVNEKLSSKFYGSYAIIERVGLVAYSLELPLKAKVHPIFRMSQI